MVAGIVLTGGGSKLEGACDLAKDSFDMPVRVGSPQQLKDITGHLKDPSHATGFGLLLYAKDLTMHAEANRSERNRFRTAFLRAKHWLQSQY